MAVTAEAARETTGERAEAPLVLPEGLKPREYGRKETQPLELRGLIRLSQQRGVNNSEKAKIKDSIERGDLINQIDVAFLTYEAFSEYVNFVNRVWHKSHDVADFEPDSEGYYHLVIAGDTRVEAIEELEAERAERAKEAGFDITDPNICPPAVVWSKVHRNKTPMEILGLQVDENLHEKPSQERTAMGLVELFMYGKDLKAWETRPDFLRALNNKFSRESLDAALLFYELDEEIRAFVFTGEVRYGPVVELAKTVKTHRDYLAYKFFDGRDYDSLNDGEKAEVDEEVRQWNAVQIIKIQEGKLNVTAAKLMFNDFVSNWKTKIGVEDKQGSLFRDPRALWRERRAKTRRKLRDGVVRLGKLSSENAVQMLQLHLEIMDPTKVDEEVILAQVQGSVGEFDTVFRRVVAAAVGQGAVAGASKG